MMTTEEIAAGVKHNSILRGTVTREQVESIDWITLVNRNAR